MGRGVCPTRAKTHVRRWVRSTAALGMAPTASFTAATLLLLLIVSSVSRLSSGICLRENDVAGDKALGDILIRHHLRIHTAGCCLRWVHTTSRVQDRARRSAVLTFETQLVVVF